MLSKRTRLFLILVACSATWPGALHSLVYAESSFEASPPAPSAEEMNRMAWEAPLDEAALEETSHAQMSQYLRGFFAAKRAAGNPEAKPQLELIF